MKTPTQKLLGYYTFQNSPKIVSPWHSGVDNPTAIEMHELTHRGLIDSSTTGHLCRLITLVLSSCKDELLDSMAHKFKAAFNALVYNTRAPHESIATFCQFLYLRNANGENAELIAREKLPPYYVRVLKILEDALAPYRSTSAMEQYLVLFPVVHAIGIVTLSPPCLHFAEEWESLDKIPGYIALNSPNARYGDILEILGKEKAIEQLIIQSKECWKKEFGRDLWDGISQVRIKKLSDLAKEIPTFSDFFHPLTVKMTEIVEEIAIKHSIPAMAKQDVITRNSNRVLLSWKRDFSILSFKGIEDIEPAEIPGNTDLDELLNFQYVMPGTTRAEIHDASLDRLCFRDLDFDHVFALFTLARGANCLIFVNLKPGDESWKCAPLENDSALLELSAYLTKSQRDISGLTIADEFIDLWGRPFRAVVSLMQWTIIHRVIDGSQICIKLLDTDVAENPLIIGLVQTLSYNTVVMMSGGASVSYISTIIEMMITFSDEVNATAVFLGWDGTYVIIINHDDSKIAYCGLLSKSVWIYLKDTLFKEDMRVNFRVTSMGEVEKDIFDSIGLSQEFVSQLIISSYLL